MPRGHSAVLETETARQLHPLPTLARSATIPHQSAGDFITPSRLFAESVTHAFTQFLQREGLIGRRQDGVRGECQERFWRRGCSSTSSTVLGGAVVSPLLLIDVERKNFTNYASINFGIVEAIRRC